MSGCGKPAKGSHKDDDVLACGTKVTFGVGREPQVTKILLCDRCQAATIVYVKPNARLSLPELDGQCE